jgi:sugar phosphate isomerase/epimerase
LKYSLSTGMLYAYPLRTVFRWARTAGFDAVEVTINPEAIARGGQTVRRIADAEGVALASVHPTLLPIHGWRERHGGTEPTIRWALEAGAGIVAVHVPRSESLDEGEGRAFRERIETWQVRLADTELRLAVENKAIHHEPERRFALSPLDCLRAFADHYDLGLILDTTHAATAAEAPQTARQIFDSRLVNVHLSDTGGWIPLAKLPLARRLLAEHRFPGNGNLPLAALMADLAATCYTGLVTLEVNPLEVRAWWPPAVQRYLARAVAWMRQTSNSIESRSTAELPVTR